MNLFTTWEEWLDADAIPANLIAPLIVCGPQFSTCELTRAGMCAVQNRGLFVLERWTDLQGCGLCMGIENARAVAKINAFMQITPRATGSISLRAFVRWAQSKMSITVPQELLNLLQWEASFQSPVESISSTAGRNPSVQITAPDTTKPTVQEARGIPLETIIKSSYLDVDKYCSITDEVPTANFGQESPSTNGGQTEAEATGEQKRHIPRDLWVQKSLQQVCDDMRVAGFEGDAIAYALFHWRGIKNMTEIGTLLRGDGMTSSGREKHARKVLKKAGDRYYTD